MNYTSRDILTPANAITLTGLLITLIGCLRLNTPLGLALVFIGRSFDLIDGPVARATKTTKFSVFFDPTADKIALAGIIAAVTYYNMAPLPIVLYIVAQNLLVAVLSIIAQQRRVAVGALIPGKLNLFFQTGAIFLFIVAYIFHARWSSLASTLAYVSFAISIPLAIVATKAYADLLRRKDSRESV